jgi:hypothetical protein
VGQLSWWIALLIKKEFSGGQLSWWIALLIKKEFSGPIELVDCFTYKKRVQWAN